MSLIDHIDNYTRELEQHNLLRVRRIAHNSNPQHIRFDSNDYLSLTHDKTIASAYQKGYALHPAGSGGSMLLGGYHANHQAVEHAFAQLLDVEQCLLFSSGYAANLAVAALFAKIKLPLLIDKGVHASIYDGLALSQTDFKRYSHNDLNDLNVKRMQINTATAVLTEGIFSMTGHKAPLDKIASLCAVHTETVLIVDEAHSFGLFGEHGCGMAALCQLTQEQVPLRIIPLGKACAAQGAIVAGQGAWINALMQAGRSFVYSTAVSPAQCYGLIKTLEVVANADLRRLKLQQLIHLFQSCSSHSPLSWSDSSTAIQHLHLGCPRLALSYQAQLEQAGFSCAAVRAPTVTKKHTGLRIVLNYNHQPEQIINLFDTLHSIYEFTSN
ncbi:MAG: aminotransferase class I/II-fold pyridoxal phosphate-dependent enzyme [Legionella sp.]